MTQRINDKLKKCCELCQSNLDKPCAWLSLGNEYCDTIMEVQADIEIKDKVIDDLCFAITHEEIPQEFYCHSISINCEVVGGTMECKECLKQAVYKQVEKVGGKDE